MSISLSFKCFVKKTFTILYIGYIDVRQPGSHGDSDEKIVIAGAAIGGAILIALIIVIVATISLFKGRNGTKRKKQTLRDAQELQVIYFPCIRWQEFHAGTRFSF